MRTLLPASRWRILGALVVCAILVAVFVHRNSPKRGMVLAQPETFRWTEQAITFSPPNDSWTRERYQEGRVAGVQFTRYEAPPSRIEIGESMLLTDRNRRAELQALLDDIDAGPDSISPRSFSRRISLARLPVDDPLTRDEADRFQRANADLDRAMEDLFAGRPWMMRRMIEAALDEVSAVSYTLEDLFPRFQLRAERFTMADSFAIAEPESCRVGGFPAAQTDYALLERSMLHHGREIWVVAGDHAYVFGFLGRTEFLPLFAALIASVSFADEDPQGVAGVTNP